MPVALDTHLSRHGVMVSPNVEILDRYKSSAKTTEESYLLFEEGKSTPRQVKAAVRTVS